MVNRCTKKRLGFIVEILSTKHILNVNVILIDKDYYGYK